MQKDWLEELIAATNTVLLLPEEKWDDETEIENTIQFILYGLTPRI